MAINIFSKSFLEHHIGLFLFLLVVFVYYIFFKIYLFVYLFKWIALVCPYFNFYFNIIIKFDLKQNKTLLSQSKYKKNNLTIYLARNVFYQFGSFVRVFVNTLCRGSTEICVFSAFFFRSDNGFNKETNVKL